MVKRILIGLFLICISSGVFAQSVSFITLKRIAVKDSTKLDSLSILPGSLKIFNGVLEIPSNQYHINYAKAQLTWKIKPPADSLNIQFRTLPISFAAKQFHKNPSLIEQQVIDSNPYIYSIGKEENAVFNLDGFNKSGSISRGIGFGNNQDLSVNSNLVLQLSGKLNNDIEILAAISDDNIPIQPEGNTQQINDFDKVFIQLKRKGTTLIAGDYELRRPDSYFTNYYKRTQGAFVSNVFKDKKGNEFETKFAGAVAKGRSARNLINGIEGNQGPYRLTGNNGEQYIIVLSGTERIYLDGNLLLRGQDNDYIMDYNTAELTFTTKRLVTRNSRISVEFEYSDKVFARSLYSLNQGFKSEKLKMNFNYYSEQDNPNRPFLQDLNDNQKRFLSNIGNQIDQAIYPNIDSVGFNQNEILYKKIDTLSFQGVYVYSTNPTLAKYRVGFTYLGPKRGNYRLNSSAQANGRVYSFIAPVNGISQGDYAPVTLLITPKKQQLMTLNAKYQIGKRTNIFSEVGMSNNDLNLFSKLQNSQNKGVAYKIILNDQRLLNNADSLGWKVKTSLSYEYANQRFKPLERYRPVEFDRDFNFRGVNLPDANEYWSTLNLQLLKSPNKQFNYGISSFVRKGNYHGLQQNFSTNYEFDRFKVSYNGSFLNSNTHLDNGKFLKQKFALAKSIKFIESGFIYEQELNRTSNKSGDSLSFQSFAFRQYDFFLKSADTSKKAFLLQYSKRFDDLPIDNKLNAYTKANTFTGKWTLTQNSRSNLSINATYRNLNYLNNDTLKKNEETLLGRIDYNFNTLKGFINFQSFYELGTGQEPKREFIYLEVAAGQGIYSWNDYNKNGIKELNEFEIAKYQDEARYIKIFRPTNEFIRSNFTNVNQTLTLNAASLFKDKKKGFYAFLSKLSNISVLRIDKKVLAGNGLKLNPYQTQIDLNNLVALNSFIRNTFFFNRSNPVFGMDFNFQKSASKLLLTNGFDSRNNQEQGLRIRWNFLRKSNFIISLNSGSKKYNSQLFTERNYLINYFELLPEFGYQSSSNFKTTFKFDLKNQKNEVIFGGERNLNIKLSVETRYNVAKKGTLLAQLNLINNKFKGANNSSIAYEILDGLQPGSNLTWSAGFQRTISNGIQLNFTYDGRKSDGVKTIHTGGLQVRAYF
jgi:hypothetical protein